MSGELKACPFCGGSRAHSFYVRDGRRAGCPDCGASAGSAFHGPADKPSAEDRAIAAWNRRARLSPGEPSGEGWDDYITTIFAVDSGVGYNNLGDVIRAGLRALGFDGHLQRRTEEIVGRIAALARPPEAAAEIEALRADAERYRYLRSRDAGPMDGPTPAGLFIGRVPENTILTEADADEAVDAARQALQQGEG